MSDSLERRNVPLWWGFALALASVLSNSVLFLSPPGQAVLPWISIALAVLALVFLVRGLEQVFRTSRGPASKFGSWVLALACLFLVGLSALASFKSRNMPAAAEAPQIGQTAPEFMLTDTHNRPVSLAQLFSSAENDPPPKAVLLIFYRGYW